VILEGGEEAGGCGTRSGLGWNPLRYQGTTKTRCQGKQIACQLAASMVKTQASPTIGLASEGQNGRKSAGVRRNGRSCGRPFWRIHQASHPLPWCKLPHPLVQIAPPPSKPSHRVAGLPGGRTEFMHCGRRRTRVRFVEVLVVLQPVRAAVGGTISAGNLQINNGGTLRLQGGQSAEGGHPVGHRSDVPQARPASDGGASENQPRVRTQKRTSMSISGTSMSTPTTVASAAPDARP
jgi:hypothetical protein